MQLLCIVIGVMNNAIVATWFTSETEINSFKMLGNTFLCLLTTVLIKISFTGSKSKMLLLISNGLDFFSFR